MERSSDLRLFRDMFGLDVHMKPLKEVSSVITEDNNPTAYLTYDLETGEFKVEEVSS